MPVQPEKHNKPCRYGHTEGRSPSRNCKVCNRETQRKLRQDPTFVEKQRERRRRKLCSPPTRPCPAFCECCGDPPGKQNMHLDHDHITGEFRGWLCSECNLGIGKLGDCAAGVKRAVSYLEST